MNFNLEFLFFSLKIIRVFVFSGVLFAAAFLLLWIDGRYHQFSSKNCSSRRSSSSEKAQAQKAAEHEGEVKVETAVATCKSTESSATNDPESSGSRQWAVNSSTKIGY